MDLDRNTTSVVVNRDGTVLAIDYYFDVVHGRIANLVVCGVDQNLVKNLVETWNDFDVPEVRQYRRALLEHHHLLFRIIDPHLLSLGFGGANVLSSA